MKNIFRAFSLVFLFITSVVFSFVCIGAKKIPDKIEIVENEIVSLQEYYSPKIFEKNISVFSAKKYNDETSKSSGHYDLNVSFLHSIPVKSAAVIVNPRQYVVPSGEIFGVKMFMNGVMIVGMDDVQTKNGHICPAKDAGLKLGDVIYSINGQSINTITELNQAFQKSKEIAEVYFIRKGEKEKTNIHLALSNDGTRKRAGFWVRDSTAGVGTMTFYHAQNGVFGGLGHGICDSDSGQIVPLKSGEAVQTKIQGCYKASPGITGEICGVFQKNKIGTLLANQSNGVYGVLQRWDSHKKSVPVATKKEIRIGPATILSTLDESGPHAYSVFIKKIYPNSDENGKNLVLEITDPTLIAKTGGIIQGMSGSPILQNGMLVGAVTHVFVNNALQGYGVFAETMLQQAHMFQMQEQKLEMKKAS